MQEQGPCQIRNKESIFKQLQQTKKQLFQSLKQQSRFVEKLSLICMQLSRLVIEDYFKIQTLMYNVLKPLSTEITNYNPKQLTTLRQMKGGIFKIVQTYCRIFVQVGNLSALELIKELICRDSILFVKKPNYNPTALPCTRSGSFYTAQRDKVIIEQQPREQQVREQQVINPQRQKQKVYKWAKDRIGYTALHRDCCQLVYDQLNCLRQRLETTTFPVIRQLISFVYFLQDFIFDESIYAFALGSFQYLTGIVSHPSKENVKLATKQMFEDISEKLLKLLHYYHQDEQVRRGISLLGPQFAVNLLNAQNANIQMKLSGLRVLQKFASGFYYKGPKHLNNQHFAQWLLKNGLWNLLASRVADSTIVQASENILKLMISKGKLSRDEIMDFLDVIWLVKTEVRVVYLKTLGQVRLSYHFISLAIQKFTVIQQNPELYLEEFFTLMEDFVLYCTYAKTKVIVELLLNIIKRHFFGFRQSLKRKALDALQYCFQKKIDSESDNSYKTQSYVCILSVFIEDPNYLTLSMARMIFETEYKKNCYAQQKAARQVVQSKGMIEAIMEHMQQPIKYKQQLMYFLKVILRKYRGQSMSNSISISQDILLKSTAHPQIFTQLIDLCPNDGCEELFLRIVSILEQRQINFACVSQLFYKLNHCFVDVVEGGYFRAPDYLLKCDPSQLKFIHQLQDILQHCKFPSVQQKCAQLIANTHTCFSQIYLQRGKEKTKQFIQQLINQIESISLKQGSFANKQNQTLLYGKLHLIREMLKATEVRGVGNLRAHNSLITTSMIKVKICNNASYGDDVQKCYEKTVPSSLTVFDLLSKVGEKFKCGQQELYLQEGINPSIPSKMNGHTLLELGFDNSKEFSAYKNRSVQVKKQHLKIDNQLSSKFLAVLKQIFKMYSKQGKMGEQQIVDYIHGVTGIISHTKDSRVVSLLQQYDSDHDGYLNEQDLIKIYQDKCDDGQKQQQIWTNLTKLHYRRDLRKFDQAMDPIQPQSLFRFYMKSSLKSYELLFALSKSPILSLSYLAKSILVHLPTSEYLMENYAQQLQFFDKSTFQISYMMVNVRYFMQKQQKMDESKWKVQQYKQEQLYKSQMEIQTKNKNQGLIQGKQATYQQQQESLFSKIEQQSATSKGQTQKQHINYIQRFIENKNDNKIFKLIQELSSKQGRSGQQQVLRVVSINTLRTLINFPSLNDSYMNNERYDVGRLNYMLSSMNTLNSGQQGCRFFVQMARKCCYDKEFTVFQAALALSLLQPSFQWESWLQQCIFHSQHQIRKTTMNFLILFSLKQSFRMDIFSLNVSIVQSNCQQWFSLLSFYISNNKECDLNKILQKTLHVLDKQSQEIQQRYFNPIMNGNLKLLRILLSMQDGQRSLEKHQIIYNVLQRLVEKTLNNENRMIQYQLLLTLNPERLMGYLYDLIRSIKPTDKYQMKQNFVGIKNLGSTCYMNSILQQFFSITSFKDLVLTLRINQIPELTQVNGYHIVDDFLYQLQKMYTYLSLSKKRYYNPKQFCLSIKDYDKKPINTLLQEDAHQFLNNLFGKIQGYFKGNGKLSELQKIFQGKTMCEITCKQCQNKIQKVEDFYHLALGVKGLDRLSDSFDKFIAPEMIEDYYCQKCQKKAKQITKQTFLKETPDILIINLQRITFDLNLYQKVKVHSRLEFPQQLDISPYLHPSSSCPSHTYKLKGVVIHLGTSQGGHYYSLVKVDNQWYKFNDQSVSRFSFSDLERQAYGCKSTDDWGDTQYSTNAYILFYEVQRQANPKGQATDRLIDSNSSNQTIFRSQNGTRRHLSDEVNNRVQLVDKVVMSPKLQMRQTRPCQGFQKQVDAQNATFYKQLQIHQESYFCFINRLYLSIRPHHIFSQQRNPSLFVWEQWSNLPNLVHLQRLFDIFMQVVKFYQTFSSINRQILTQSTQAVCQLLSLLPEKTSLFVQQHLDQNNWVNVICEHNQTHVRELYQVVLNKLIFVHGNYFGYFLDQNDQNAGHSREHQDNPNRMQESKPKGRLKLIMDTFLNAASSGLVAKNLFKAYFFFEFWKVNMDTSPQIYQYCLKSNYLFTLLDLMMANQSPFAPRDKKRQDLTCQVAVPLVLSLLKLIQHKKNLAMNLPFRKQSISTHLYQELTQKQSEILSSTAFYKKMMKFKYDNGQLAVLIYFMSFGDRQFSQKITQLFLIGLNKLQQVEDGFSLLNNIKAFLLIQDEFQGERMRWLLGVPQFLSTGRLSYALQCSYQSSNIVYVSSRYFSLDQKYKPALQVLHDKRFYLTDFQARGVTTLMQILISSSQSLKYILSIPPPSYLYESYLTWIQDYIGKVQQQQSCEFSMDKKALVQNMRALYSQLIKKIAMIKVELPVLRYIIGKNKYLQAEEQLSNSIFHVRRWGSQTYTLNNLPKPSNRNQSLPEQMFGIRSPKDWARYFIENCDIQDCELQVPSDKTITSLKIETKKPLKLKFCLPSFQNQIYVPKGQTTINYLYTDFPLQQYMQVQILGQKQQEQQMQESGPKYGKMEMELASNVVGQTQTARKAVRTDSFQAFETPCPMCTYINFGRDRCQICQAPLN